MFITSASFRQRTLTKKWSIVETEQFYSVNCQIVIYN